MEKEELKKVLELHEKWLNKEEGGVRANLSYAKLTHADLKYADLRSADLKCADLTHADLRCANLDYSCLPLWCGSLKIHMDDRQVKQLLYQTLSIVKHSKNVSSELKEKLLTENNLMIANEFHRVGECGELQKGADMNVYKELKEIALINEKAKELAEKVAEKIDTDGLSDKVKFSEET